MSENPATPCLLAALVEVRKAYRLLWLYQQTLMDAYTQIIRHLNVKHYYGELDPLLRNTNVAQKPPRTLLPLLAINTLYLNRTGEANRQKPDDYLVDMMHIADTGCTDNGYPTDTCAVSDARSELRVYVFHARAVSSLDWYNNVWWETEYPAHDTKLLSAAQPSIQVYGYHFDVATLTDQQTIATHMAHFKGRVKAELGLQL
jgi:hypothetical protein